MGRFSLRCGRRALTGVKVSLIRLKDSLALALEVLELAPLQGPAKDGQYQQHQAGRQRDQQIQAFHQRTWATGTAWAPASAARNALSTTNIELAAMPSPAAQGGSQPIRARGTHTAL